MLRDIEKMTNQDYNNKKLGNMIFSCHGEDDPPVLEFPLFNKLKSNILYGDLLKTDKDSSQDDSLKTNNNSSYDNSLKTNKDSNGNSQISASGFNFTHCFTTRLGGVSEGIFSTMNLSFTRGDDPEHVMENHRRIAVHFGVRPEDIVTIDQQHTNHVVRVTRANAGEGVTKERTLTAVDGMVTNEPGLLLMTSHADCTPLYFVDPVHRAIGLSHSGWRGTAAKIGLKTVELMQQEFGTNASDIYAAIGPCISADCYEIGQDVAEEFVKSFQGDLMKSDADLENNKQGKYEEQIIPNNPNQGNNLEICENPNQDIRIDNNQNSLPGILRKRPDTPGHENKWDLNLTEANYRILLEAGIPADHIVTSGICTFTNSDILFSHRATHGKRGNLGAFLMIK